jgi:hypothetical protein
MIAPLICNQKSDQRILAASIATKAVCYQGTQADQRRNQKW